MTKKPSATPESQYRVKPASTLQVTRQDSLGRQLEINTEEANKIQLNLDKDEDTPKFAEE